MSDLQNFEVTLPDISFTLEDFNDVELTVTEMDALMPFLAE
jgi:hypothetical protein